MLVLGSGRQKIPLPPPVPLRRGIKGEDRGCKLVLMKLVLVKHVLVGTGNGELGIAQKKHNPLNPPFLRGINSSNLFLFIERNFKEVLWELNSGNPLF